MLRSSYCPLVRTRIIRQDDGRHVSVTIRSRGPEHPLSARQGDLIEMGLRATAFGRTSITMRAEVRNMISRKSILTIEKLVFVSLDEHGAPVPHGFTEITYQRDRIPTEREFRQG